MSSREAYAGRPWRHRVTLAAVISVLRVGGVSSAGQSVPATDHVLRVEVNQVLLNVTVLDSRGGVVTGLRPEDFEVIDNGIRHPIQSLEQSDVPASIGLVLDNSRSIRSNRDLMVSAALKFLDLLGPDDEVFVLHFSDDVTPVPTRRGVFTADRNVLETAIRAWKPVGVTRLYDAVAAGLGHMEGARWQRKALIVLSDGGDNGSAFDEDGLREMIEVSDAPIFPIGIIDSRWNIDPDVLLRLAQGSGGRAFFPGEFGNLPAIWTEIATLIHSQYTIGYVPASAEPGFHPVRVRIRGRDLGVSTRPGYWVTAPGR